MGAAEVGVAVGVRGGRGVGRAGHVWVVTDGLVGMTVQPKYTHTNTQTHTRNRSRIKLRIFTIATAGGDH